MSSYAQRDRTLAAHVPVFLTWLRTVGHRRKAVVAAYGKALETFLGFCAQVGVTLPDQVQFQHCECYLAWLEAERGLTDSSADRHLHALKVFFRWMEHHPSKALATPYATYQRLWPTLPKGTGCRICGGTEQRDDLLPCERCHIPMHWDCYWDCIASRVEYRGAKRHARDDRAPRVLILCHGCRS